MEEILTELRGCMETAKRYNGMDKAVKEECKNQELFSSSYLDQIKSGRVIPNTESNRTKAKRTINIYETMLHQVAKEIEVITS